MPVSKESFIWSSRGTAYFPSVAKFQLLLYISILSNWCIKAAELVAPE